MSYPKEGRFWELERWIDANGSSIRDFAGRAGHGKNAIHKLVSGKLRRRDPFLEADVIAATDGGVSKADFDAFWDRRLKAQMPEAAE
jgi:hypothetical protein